MKIFVDPIPQLSRAMHRVSDALKEFPPEWADIVSIPKEADLQILHVIGKKAITKWMRAPKFVAIQYIRGPLYALGKLHPNQRGSEGYNWTDLWDAAEMVWSYYDLSESISADKFYFAPLGVPKYFAENRNGDYPRDIDIFTSGYVSGKGAEAIEEVARAAKRLGKKVVHLGPKWPRGMEEDPGPRWKNTLGISDSELSLVYQRTKWVSGLRQIEGFEYPVIEGLVSGCRPIVFDRPDMRRWYEGHAVFIRPCHGDELVEILVELLSQEPEPVTKGEIAEVQEKFNREKISKEFWLKLRKAVDR